MSASRHAIRRLPQAAWRKRRAEQLNIIGYFTSNSTYVHPAFLFSKNGEVLWYTVGDIVNVHGGPQARYVWTPDQYALFASNLGIAVLSIDFRFSYGYGNEYTDKASKNMFLAQQDVFESRQWAIENGLKSPILIVYSGKDDAVYPSQNIRAIKELTEAGNVPQVVYLPDIGHTPDTGESILTVFEAIRSFLTERFLGSSTPETKTP